MEDMPPTLYRALTATGIRMAPDVYSERSGARVEKEEVFEVLEVRAGPGFSGRQRFLKLAGRDGWVFTVGIAGAWYDKDIAVPATDADLKTYQAQKAREAQQCLEALEKGPPYSLGDRFGEE